jgi:hypothetical protein
LDFGFDFDVNFGSGPVSKALFGFGLLCFLGWDRSGNPVVRPIDDLAHVIEPEGGPPQPALARMLPAGHDAIWEREGEL